MKGTDFVRSLPAVGPEREDQILKTIKDGHHKPLTWEEVPTEANGHSGVLFVSDDALQVGDEDHVRVNATHATAERLARHFQCYLPTSKIADLIYQAAAHQLAPCLQPPDQATRLSKGYSPSMMDNEAMLRHHEEVEEQRGGRFGLLAPVGKDWVDTNKLDRNPTKAANYGWHSPSAGYQAATPGGGRVWQPVGLAHNLAHVDYSQVVRLVRAEMVVDGKRMATVDVAKDPDLCWLVSAETEMDLRHPGVPAFVPTDGVAVGVDGLRAPLFTRTLRQGAVGDDVKALQVIIGADADGIFGSKTKLAVMRWQDEHGLVADGIVGPQTRTALMKEVHEAPSPEHLLEQCGKTIAEIDATLAELGVELTEPESVDLTFIQAKHYRWANRGAVHWINLHSMEAPEKPNTAEAVGRWFGGLSGEAPKASAHYNFDNDSAVQSVLEEHIAFQAHGANPYSVGYEHAGYARQSRAEWLDDYSESMLWLSAKVAGETTCPRWNIPHQFIDVDGLKQAKVLLDRGEPVPDELRGFAYHSGFVKAGFGGNHGDPGKGFPIDVYLRMVDAAAKG